MSRRQGEVFWQQRSSGKARRKKQSRRMLLDVLEKRELLIATPAYFDFGTASSALETGYERVTDATTYNSSQGFGWDATTGLTSTNLSGPDSVRRDYVQGGVSRSFYVDLANGTYDVTITSGGSLLQGNVKFTLEGSAVETLTTASDQYFTSTYRVTVSDGQLTLEIEDLDASNKRWHLNGLVIVEANDPTPPAPLTSLSLDFGTSSSNVASGYTRATNLSLYSPQQQWGWDRYTIEATAHQSGPDDLRRDSVQGTVKGMLLVDLANGTYDVTITSGGPFSQNNVVFALQGSVVGTANTSASQFFEQTYRVAVVSNRLTLEVEDTDASSKRWYLNGLSIVPAPNTPPVGNDDAYGVNADQELSVIASGVLANDTDADGHTLSVDSWDAVSASGVAIVGNANGSFTYDPRAIAAFIALTAGQTLQDTFSYTVKDNFGGSDTATVTITVTGVNSAPTAIDDEYQIDEDTLLTIGAALGLLANDTDPDAGQTLSVSAFDAASVLGAAVSVNADGSFTYDPRSVAQLQALAPGQSLQDTFGYTVSDGAGGFDTATVTITVTGLNDAPVAVDDTAQVDEDGTVLIDVLANDTDLENDSLAIHSLGTPTHGTVVSENGQVRYTPPLNFNGIASFSYVTADGRGGFDTATVIITVSAVNDPPAIQAPSAQEMAYGTVLIFSSANGNLLLVSDVDAGGEPIQVTLTAANGTITLQNTAGVVFSAGDGTQDTTMAFSGTVADVNLALSHVTFSPAAEFVGLTSIEIHVDDLGNSGAGGALTDTDVISVTVLPSPPLPPFQVSFNSGHLWIQGTSGADSIVVSSAVVNNISVVRINGAPFGAQELAAADVTAIRIDAHDGADTVDLTGVNGAHYTGLNPAGRPIVVFGGDGDDTLMASPLGDALYGEGGDDTLLGSIGNDLLNGGDGDDLLYSGTGSGSGYDALYGASASVNGDELHIQHEQVYWQTFESKTVYLPNNTTMWAPDLGATGLGSTLLTASGSVSGGYSGYWSFSAATSTLSIIAEGHFTLYENNGYFELYWELLPVPTSAVAHLYVELGSGDDGFYAGVPSLQSVTMYGGDGNDSLGVGGSAASYLFGGAGNDTLVGGEGSDYLYGEDGDDSLDGGDGEDYLYGGAGNDYLASNGSSNGNNYMYGEAGDDTYLVTGSYDYWSDYDGVTTLIDGTTNETYSPPAGYGYGFGSGSFGDSGYTSSGVYYSINEYGHDLYTLVIIGTSSNDGVSLWPNGGGSFYLNDVNTGIATWRVKRIYFDGGDGDDNFTLGAWEAADFIRLESVTLHGGDGNDYLGSAVVPATIYGGAGDDTLFGGLGDDTLYGGDGDDWLVGAEGDDHLEGGDGHDQLFGDGDGYSFVGGEGNDTLLGGTGNDTLYGGAGSDWLYGGDGDDVLIAGGDSESNNVEDYLYGGPGDDVLIVDGDTDYWNDFEGENTLYDLISGELSLAEGEGYGFGETGSSTFIAIDVYLEDLELVVGEIGLDPPESFSPMPLVPENLVDQFQLSQADLDLVSAARDIWLALMLPASAQPGYIPSATVSMYADIADARWGTAMTLRDHLIGVIADPNSTKQDFLDHLAAFIYGYDNYIEAVIQTHHAAQLYLESVNWWSGLPGIVAIVDHQLMERVHGFALVTDGYALTPTPSQTSQLIQYGSRIVHQGQMYEDNISFAYGTVQGLRNVTLGAAGFLALAAFLPYAGPLALAAFGYGIVTSVGAHLAENPSVEAALASTLADTIGLSKIQQALNSDDISPEERGVLVGEGFGQLLVTALGMRSMFVKGPPGGQSVKMPTNFGLRFEPVMTPGPGGTVSVGGTLVSANVTFTSVPVTPIITLVTSLTAAVSGAPTTHFVLNLMSTGTGGPSATPSPGLGEWQPDTKYMPESARQYQGQITGRPYEKYVVDSPHPEFDGWDGSTLLEAKGPGYAKHILPNGEFKGWFSGAQAMIDQLIAQNNKAGLHGKAVVWHAAEVELVQWLQEKVSLYGLSNITVVHTPFIP